MPRIFLSLSVTSLLLIALALGYGWMGGDYNGISQQLRESTTAGADRDAVLAQLTPIQSHVRIHMLLGILASLVAVLVQSIGVTYFIGTGRWCKEVVDAYQLEDGFAAQSTKLKRRAFPFAMLGIATVLLMSAFGAAADPGTLRTTTANWVSPHFWSALAGLPVIAIALWNQTQALKQNQQLIDAILTRVREVRQSKGLQTESSQDRAGQGTAQQGKAQQGKAQQGKAQQGKAQELA